MICSPLPCVDWKVYNKITEVMQLPFLKRAMNVDFLHLFNYKKCTGNTQFPPLTFKKFDQNWLRAKRETDESTNLISRFLTHIPFQRSTLLTLPISNTQLDVGALLWSKWHPKDTQDKRGVMRQQWVIHKVKRVTAVPLLICLLSIHCDIQ